MKKFDFKLQPVLKVRETRKKIAEKAVSLTQSRLNKVISEVDEVKHKRDLSYHFEVPGTERLYWMEICQNYRHALHQQEEQLEEQKQKLEKQLHVEKNELIGRLRDEKVLTTLKETKLQEFLIEVDKVDQKEAEELDILKRGKKS